jgi:hypothetical protein
MHLFRCSMWIFVIGLVLANATAAENQCSFPNANSSSKDLIAFLRSSLNLSPERRDNSCIEFAIRHLEYKYSEQTTELLLHYLDFKRPLTQAESSGFMINGPVTEATLYPAIGTLSTFGKPALPELLSVIANSASDVSTRNATHTIMEIFRSAPVKGIEALQKQASVSPPESAARFKNAAQVAVQWCSQRFRSQCDAVALSHQ